MEFQIKEFAELTGVSVRTLHYYDEIGLLRPGRVDFMNGYRYYNEESVSRMQEILFFRELDFPLQEISVILASKNYNKQRAMAQQRELLLKKKERISRLIDLLDQAMKGENKMSFTAFDNSELEEKKKEYQKEVKEKYGTTEAYRENEKKWSGISNEDQQKRIDGLNDKMKEFAELMRYGVQPTEPESTKKAAELQAYITEYFYTCTNEILMGLGETYVTDERFRKNIDRNGEGTAQFIKEAITAYCSQITV